MSTTYKGRIVGGETQVLVDSTFYVDQVLDPRLDLRNHSPSGFAWGYGGSGPAQLALAILVHHLSGKADAELRQLAARFDLDEGQPPEALALMTYQKFKFAVIGHLPQNDGFTLTSEQVNAAFYRILDGQS